MVMVKKCLLWGILFFPAFCSITAQEKTTNNWSIKFDYSRINHNYDFKYGNVGEITVEGNYRTYKLLETGLHAGYSNTI